MPLVNVVNSLNVDEALLWLLTIEDHAGNQTLRAVNNLESVVSRGHTYEAFPFDLTLPPDDGQKPQNMQLTFANVGREAVDLVRRYQSDRPPTVKLELVLSSDPDVVEKSIDFMTVTTAEYDPVEIRFSLASNFIFNRKTCLARYTSEEFPGLFFALA